MNAGPPSGYADIHNHLLPGVDDGAGSMEESLRNLRGMAEVGVRRLAVSPHLQAWIAREDGELNRRLAELEDAFARVREASAARDDLPELVFGQEILVTSADDMRRVLEDDRVGYAGIDYVLVEFGFYLSGDPLEVLHAALEAGRRPIVAHPERYNRDDALVDIAEIRRWKDAGALLQLNAGSILDRHGDGIADLAWTMLGEGLFDLIGSDHHGDDRPDTPDKSARRLRERGAGALVEPLLAENPRRILDDRQTVPVAPAGPRAAQGQPLER